MRENLQDLVGDSFHVTSFIKSNAPLRDILSSGLSMCKDFTDSDFILLMAGSNDNNPLQVLSSLHYTLQNLPSTNILVGKVYRNNYMNAVEIARIQDLFC